MSCYSYANQLWKRPAKKERCDILTWASIHSVARRLITRTHKVLWPRYLVMESSFNSPTCYQNGCQNDLATLDIYRPASGFREFWHLTILPLSEKKHYSFPHKRTMSWLSNSRSKRERGNLVNNADQIWAYFLETTMLDMNYSNDNHCRLEMPHSYSAKW